MRPHLTPRHDTPDIVYIISTRITLRMVGILPPTFDTLSQIEYHGTTPFLCHGDTCRLGQGRCGDGVHSINSTLVKGDGKTRLLTAEGHLTMYQEDCDDGNLLDGVCVCLCVCVCVPSCVEMHVLPV